MPYAPVPRIVIAGTQSGVGKTTIATAVIAALTARKTIVQPAKTGPDYIDPSFHSFAAGRDAYNLDSWLLAPPALRRLAATHAENADITVIEGVMGLHDGVGITEDGSTALTAKILDAPVLLVVNGAGTARSLAAQVMGYRDFDPAVHLAGVIVNRVSGERHWELARRAIEEFAGVPVVGRFPKNLPVQFTSRHLGLLPSNEIADLSEKIGELATVATENIDIDKVLDIARTASPLEYAPLALRPVGQVTIGVAKDDAFNFYYQDNFDLLRELGAEIRFFSPLADSQLPDGIHGVYIGGGFPEVFARRLADNGPFKRDLLAKLENGLPAFAECGGLMYLCRTIADQNGNEFDMAGFFPNRIEMTNRLERFGYVELEFTRETILGPAGTQTRAHEFHYSRIVSAPGDEPAVNVKKAGRDDLAWTDGLVRRNVLAMYPHVHFYSNPALAESFVRRCANFRQ